MEIENSLSFVNNVKRNSDVNIFLEFNDGYTLLIEGSFKLVRKDITLVDSEEYITENVPDALLEKLSFNIVKKPIISTLINRELGNIVLEFENNVWFESFLGKDDFSVWELHKNGFAICSSQGGGVVYA